VREVYVMSRPLAVSAADVIPDAADTATFNGRTIRKGTIAAFVTNAKVLQSLSPSDPGYQGVEARLRELIPDVRAVGLFDVMRPRSDSIASLLDDGSEEA
jgi:hypothetical protein